VNDYFQYAIEQKNLHRDRVPRYCDVVHLPISPTSTFTRRSIAIESHENIFHLRS